MDDGSIGVFELRFAVGDLIQHKRFGYRGVIFDVDPQFAGSQQWYDTVARSRPPKDKPWYHVLVHGAVHTTYVAERHLEPDPQGGLVDHPLIERYFAFFDGQRYVLDASVN